MGTAPQIDLFKPSPSALHDKWMHVLAKTQRVWTWTTENELAWLAELASRHSGTFLEIGSFVGRSAKVQLLASPLLSVISLDTWDDEGTYEEYQFNLRKEEAAGRVRTIVGPSHNGISKLQLEGVHSHAFDYAFIDGGHLYDDVYGDILGALKLLKPGAIICGHDYRAHLPDDGVTKAVRTLLPNHKNVIDSIWACQL